MASHGSKRRLVRTVGTLAAALPLLVLGAGCMAPAASAPSGGCAAALAYLAAHAAPGFVSYCPHAAGGNAAQTVVPPQAVTNPAAVKGMIYIADPNCPAAYMNEAANSHGHLVPDADGSGNYHWVWPVPFDPYGGCP